MNSMFCSITNGPGPIIAVANHDGHLIRGEIADNLSIDEESRLREEDPHTGEWAEIVPSRLIARYSRFEVDLNRPRETAIYKAPDDAWGLQVWKHPLSGNMIARSLALYDEYYSLLENLCREKEERYGKFVVLDLHSYNHRRQGPEGPAADPLGNPEVNIGTGTMNRDYWGELVDRFMNDLQGFDFTGRQLDVRENVKFVGRQFPKWVHTKFPESGCAIAIEFKKFFMDEWTGALDIDIHQAIKTALSSTLPGLEQELLKLGANIH